jgi:hypothetical protein
MSLTQLVEHCIFIFYFLTQHCIFIIIRLFNNKKLIINLWVKRKVTNYKKIMIKKKSRTRKGGRREKRRVLKLKLGQMRE